VYVEQLVDFSNKCACLSNITSSKTVLLHELKLACGSAFLLRSSLFFHAVSLSSLTYIGPI